MLKQAGLKRIHAVEGGNEVSVEPRCVVREPSPNMQPLDDGQSPGLPHGTLYAPRITHYAPPMFQYVALAKDKSWQPGPYPGVELMVLHKNESTGGVAVLRKFHAGVTVPAHTHPVANEFVYVLSGEWEESGVVYSTGAFFFAPKGEQHGPHVARIETISLTVFDGPLTVV